MMLADTFNTCVEYFKDMSSQFSSSGIIPEPPAEMKTRLQTYIFQETKDDNSDEIVTIFF